MAYRIYHTEGFVLQSKAVGEGDALLFLYTREMGLVIATAKSLRQGKSRLRYSLQRFSRAYVDLVRAKHGWRLTSARTIATGSELFRHPYRRTALAGIMSIMLRLIQGEEPHPELYELLLRAYAELGALESREACFLYELLVAIRMLDALGYWERLETDVSLFAEGTTWEEVARVLLAHRKTLVPRINEALKATHL